MTSFSVNLYFWSKSDHVNSKTLFSADRLSRPRDSDFSPTCAALMRVGVCIYAMFGADVSLRFGYIPGFRVWGDRFAIFSKVMRWLIFSKRRAMYFCRYLFCSHLTSHLCACINLPSSQSVPIPSSVIRLDCDLTVPS